MKLDKNCNNIEQFQNEMNSNQYACWMLFLDRNKDDDRIDVQRWISVLHVHGIEAKYSYISNCFHDIEISKTK